MSGPRGYSSYHGGRSPVWKWLVIVLLVLVILAAGGFLFLQNYLVYDDNGQARLELPWQKEDAPVAPPSSAGEPAPPPEDVSGDDLVIQQPENTQPETLRGISLGGDLAAWQTAVGGMTAAGQNAFAVTVKATGGRVNFPAQAAHQNALAANAAQFGAALPSLLASEETHSIARFSCFRDDYCAEANLDGAALKNTGGYIFWDGENQRWMDPAKPVARKYLCDLAAETAALGFDEILLTDFTYPTVGKLSKIAYGKDVVQAQQLLLFLQELKAALEAYDVLLSVELPESLFLTGVDDKAGLKLAEIAAQVDAVYVETTELAYAGLAEKLPEGVALIVQSKVAPTSTEIPYLLLGE